MVGERRRRMVGGKIRRMVGRMRPTGRMRRTVWRRRWRTVWRRWQRRRRRWRKAWLGDGASCLRPARRGRWAGGRRWSRRRAQSARGSTATARTRAHGWRSWLGFACAWGSEEEWGWRERWVLALRFALLALRAMRAPLSSTRSHSSLVGSPPFLAPVLSGVPVQGHMQVRSPCRSLSALTRDLHLPSSHITTLTLNCLLLMVFFWEWHDTTCIATKRCTRDGRQSPVLWGRKCKTKLLPRAMATQCRHLMEVRRF